MKNTSPLPETSNEEKHHFTTGAVRNKGVAGDGEIPFRYERFPTRYDLLLPTVLYRDAMTLGEGAIKYGDHNYWKGMDEKTLLNHVMAHIFCWMRGNRSEDHLAHARWGLATLMQQEETKPDLLNLQQAIAETGFYLTPEQRALREKELAELVDGRLDPELIHRDILPKKKTAAKKRSKKKKHLL